MRGLGERGIENLELGVEWIEEKRKGVVCWFDEGIVRNWGICAGVTIGFLN
jgi:hypothetical protein